LNIRSRLQGRRIPGALLRVEVTAGLRRQHQGAKYVERAVAEATPFFQRNLAAQRTNQLGAGFVH
jgi:hypothetical protein